MEQAAFNPANVVPGIGFSPDKMLQGRLFSYGDAQRYRLGVNHSQIPVNAPRCPFHSYRRDGAMRVDGNHGSFGASPRTVLAAQARWRELTQRPPVRFMAGTLPRAQGRELRARNRVCASRRSRSNRMHDIL